MNILNDVIDRLAHDCAVAARLPYGKAVPIALEESLAEPDERAWDALRRWLERAPTEDERARFRGTFRRTMGWLCRG